MTTTLLETLVQLQASLDQLGRSLRAVEPAAVVQAEEPLASAVSAMRRLRRSDVESATPSEVRAAIVRVRMALTRCEALGDTAQALGRTMTPDASYGPHGRQSAKPPALRVPLS